MRSHFETARPYLVAVTVFVVGRFILELVGAPEALVSELSVTRLLFVLPVFLGLRLAREGRRELGSLVAVNLLYVGWAILLVMIVTALDTLAGLGTHYGHGALGGHLLGHLVEFVVLGVVAVSIAWITRQLGARLSTEDESPIED